MANKKQSKIEVKSELFGDDEVEVDEKVSSMDFENDDVDVNDDKDVDVSDNDSGDVLSLDDLASMTLDNDQIQDDYKNIYPPSGDWVKSDTWEYKVFNYSDDKRKGDLSSKGRTVFAVWGRPEERVDRNGNTYAPPFLNVKVSPDKRYKDDDPTKVDFSYKLWVQAHNTYISLNEEQPDTPLKVLVMLMNDTFAVRTANGDNGPYVVDIKPKRQVRNRG